MQHLQAWRSLSSGQFIAQKKDEDRREGERSSLLLGFAELIQLLAVLSILHQDDLKKR